MINDIENISTGDLYFSTDKGKTFHKMSGLISTSLTNDSPLSRLLEIKRSRKETYWGNLKKISSVR